MTQLQALQDRLFQRLDALGIEYKTYRHPPLFSVEDSQAYRGDIPGAHCKNLFLKDKKQALWLLVALEQAGLELKSLPKRIGSARLSFGNPALLEEVLKVQPGSVTPYALINDESIKVNVVLDEAMMAEPLLNYHPLSNDATTSIAPSDLLRFIAACGHVPQVVPITE